MNSNEKSKFVALLAGVSELYSKKLSSQLLDIYWAALNGYSLQDVKTALERHIMSPDSGQFMPKPADVVRCLRGDSETQALRAWSLVNRAICEIGAYKSVVFDDSIIHIVIEEMGGWVQLCQLHENELPFRAREFEKRYASYVLQPPLHHPKKLYGLTDQHNAPLGYNNNVLTLVGNRERAKQVYASGRDSFRHYSEISSTQLLSVLSEDE